jgi:hypothetical protein
MTNYWIVVPRDNIELFELLSVAFRGDAGFHVVVDRRGPGSGGSDMERRVGMPLGPDEIVVAEQKERADRLAMGGETTRSFRHVPVRRRRIHRAASRTESSSRSNVSSGAAAGAFSAS